MEINNVVNLECLHVLDEREVNALEELLPFWQQYEGKDGTFPFKDWDIKQLLQNFVETGIKTHISEQIKDDQFRKGLIDIDELTNGNGFRIKEERESLGTEKGEEQC